MMKWRKILFFAIAVCGIAAITALGMLVRYGWSIRPKPAMTPMNSIFVLSQDKLAEYQKRASLKDGDAAFLLYQHYSFGKGDVVTGRKYLYLAHELGNQSADQAMRAQGLLK